MRLRIFLLPFYLFFLCDLSIAHIEGKGVLVDEDVKTVEFTIPLNRESLELIRAALISLDCNLSEYVSMWGAKRNGAYSFEIDQEKSVLHGKCDPLSAEYVTILFAEMNLLCRSKNIIKDDLLKIYTFDDKRYLKLLILRANRAPELK